MNTFILSPFREPFVLVEEYPRERVESTTSPPHSSCFSCRILGPESAAQERAQGACRSHPSTGQVPVFDQNPTTNYRTRTCPDQCQAVQLVTDSGGGQGQVTRTHRNTRHGRGCWGYPRTRTVRSGRRKGWGERRDRETIREGLPRWEGFSDVGWAENITHVSTGSHYGVARSLNSWMTGPYA